MNRSNFCNFRVSVSVQFLGFVQYGLLQYYYIYIYSSSSIGGTIITEKLANMFNLVSVALVLLLIAAASYLFRSKKNLPPTPVGFPVIGHLHLLKEPVHRCLRDLSQNLGPVFSLKLGSCRAVVVTSASAAEEFLTHQNDIVFANRPISTLGVYVGYNNTVVTAAPYGEHWRNLRRICTLEIFSAARLKESFEIRRDEVRALLRTIHTETTLGGDSFVRLELRPLLSGLTFNIVMRMVAGKRYYGEANEEAEEVRELISEAFEVGGFTYVGDFLPILKLLDFDGYVKRGKRLGSKLDVFLQKLVDEHRQNRGKTEFKNTMITHLLTLQESQHEYYTDEIIKGLVLVMLVAGTDTTAVTLEWAMANLLNHPEALMKTKTELNAVVSREGRLMEESDMGACTYLNNVISETLRLYPAAPLLVPHASSDDCKVAGYDIPRGTWLFVNAWAIQRDPKVWDEPETFKPERFGNEESKTQHWKFIPFGMGRRACPGMGLAHLVLGLTLGSLIQCFDWARDADVAVDMSEGRGLTMPKAVRLVAKCKSSPILDQVAF
ncbi:cytochrome P450 81Q32-like [Brassica rapa]|uniref:cytochrome P450 81Q32-like n=1 Tax=Brassica campestris TaxID=3711 RepID=UPI00142E28C9|nr:cytochrome P450 81Q32-like [Brassica rapa]